MIKEFIEAWNKNKDDLQEYFETTRQEEYNSYEKLVQLCFYKVINPYIEWEYKKFDISKMIKVDYGDYQGTQIFILPRNIYQPSVKDYVYTHTYYGSCSGCDTLLGISGYSDGLPDKRQVEDYMTLCLHLIEKCKFFRDEEDE